MKFDFKVLAGSILAASIVWISDTLPDHLFFSQKNFGDLLIFNVPGQKIFISVIILLCFFLFGNIISAYFRKHKKNADGKTNDREFWMSNNAGYSYTAPALEGITGYTSKDLNSDPSLIKEIIHPDGLDSVLKHFEDEDKNTMGISNLDFKNITKNKSIKNIQHTCKSQYDKNGKFKGTSGGNIDVPAGAVESQRVLLLDAILQAELRDNDKGIYAVDNGGKIVLMNKMFRDLWGIPGELLNIEIEDNLVEIIESKLAMPASQLKTIAGIRKNFLKNYSDQLLLKNGQKLEARSLPIQDSAGVYLGRVWNFKEAKNSGSKNNDPDNQFDILFENMPDAFFIYDLKGTFINGNNAAESLTGYKKEELIGRNYLELKLLNAPDMLKAAEILNEIEQGKTTEPVTLVINRKDGNQVPAKITSFPFRKNGKALVLGVARDISGIVENEKSLKENENKLLKITESVHDALIMTNGKGEISFWNSSAEKIFGYKRQEVYGKELTNLIFVEEFGSKFWNRSREFDETGLDPLIGEITNLPARRKNGEQFPIGLSLSLVEINGEKHTLGVVRDITDQVTSEKQLAQRTRDLQERLKELNCLYKISHSMAEENSTVDKILNQCINIIPQSLQYPEITCAKIILDEKKIFETENWAETQRQLSAEITSGSQKYGIIKIGYLDKIEFNGIEFFSEREKGFVTGIGLMIGEFIRGKNIESALIDSEHKFRTMSDAAKDAIVMMNDEGKISYWNKAAEEMFGFKSGEIVGKDLHKAIVPHKYDESFRKGYGVFNKTGKGKSIGTRTELIAVNKEGLEFPIELSLAAFELNAKWNSIGIVRDISERKSFEKQLIESEERFRKLYENSSLGIYRSTPAGKIIMANSAAVSLLGYATPEEMKKININNSYCSPGERNIFQEILEREGIIHGFETQLKKQDGTLVYIRESARVIRDSKGKIEYYEGMFEDFTDKKKAEEELLKAKDLAEEINRLKTNFLANMSHELRTPITGITGFADLLRDELENKDHKQMATNIIESGERLSNSLNLILDLTLLETNKLKIEPGKINIVEALEESISSCKQETNKKGLQFLFEKEETQIFCNLDRQLFIRSVRNFLDNAVKFTIKGSISVKVFSNGQAVIQIKDTGIGIPKDMLNVIFEPFRQGSEGYNRNYEGTGLGLTLAKRYIEISGGTVSVESEETSGTTFTIRFPEIKNTGINV